jgi:Ca2+-binding EF-hand superfamily protein
VVADPIARTEMDAEERAQLEAELGGACASASGRNRGNVCLAVQGVSSQVRALLKSSARQYGVNSEKEGFNQLFRAFDADGSGEIDKAEFQSGLQKLGILLTGAEVDLLWPLFDLDGSGEVDLQELIEFLTKGGKKGVAGQDERETREKDTMDSSKVQRIGRIEQKTNYRKVMLELRTDLKFAINQHLIFSSKTSTEFFTEFDTDGNGVFDMKEFIYLLAKVDIEVGEAEMNMLWPLLCEENMTVITRIKFLDFLKKADSSWQW